MAKDKFVVTTQGKDGKPEVEIRGTQTVFTREEAQKVVREAVEDGTDFPMTVEVQRVSRGDEGE